MFYYFNAFIYFCFPTQNYDYNPDEQEQLWLKKKIR